MILHHALAEQPFLDRIDGAFPYDTAAAETLIHEGWATSLNAAFQVLHELCRPPASASVSVDRCRDLVAAWSAGGEHALKTPVCAAAEALLAQRPLPLGTAAGFMRAVAGYDGQRAALSIVYFAADHDDPRADQIERLDAQIRRAWTARGV